MSESGWQAECLMCPTTTGWAYGEKIRVGARFTGELAMDEARAWRDTHRRENPGHLVRVWRFVTVEFDPSTLDPETWKVLSGEQLHIGDRDPQGPPPSA